MRKDVDKLLGCVKNQSRPADDGSADIIATYGAPHSPSERSRHGKQIRHANKRHNDAPRFRRRTQFRLGKIAVILPKFVCHSVVNRLADDDALRRNFGGNVA